MAAPAALSAIGLIGLAPMGRNLAGNLLDKGMPVYGWERDPAIAAAAGAQLPAEVPQRRIEDVVAALSPPRCVLLMIASGAPVDDCLGRLGGLLQPGDIVIDGGNSHPDDTGRRQAELRRRGIALLGVGISGGPQGARLGPAIMAGGPMAAWDVVRLTLENIAAAGAGVPMPAFASALAYVEMRGRDRLPTALTQLQRDFFGDHGLRRRDGAALRGPWRRDGGG